MNKCLTSNIPFDSLKPDIVINHFCSAINVMKEKYEYDISKCAELEAQLEDLLNFIEMEEVAELEKQVLLYDKLFDIKNEIRYRKNEATLLEPIYNLFSDEVVGMMEETSKECHDIKTSLSKQSYTLKTNIMNELLE